MTRQRALAPADKIFARSAEERVFDKVGENGGDSADGELAPAEVEQSNSGAWHVGQRVAAFVNLRSLRSPDDLHIALRLPMRKKVPIWRFFLG
jgi:hypothetical protein